MYKKIQTNKGTKPDEEEMKIATSEKRRENFPVSCQNVTA